MASMHTALPALAKAPGAGRGTPPATEASPPPKAAGNAVQWGLGLLMPAAAAMAISHAGLDLSSQRSTMHAPCSSGCGPISTDSQS